jgi:hypothetical protein
VGEFPVAECGHDRVYVWRRCPQSSRWRRKMEVIIAFVEDLVWQQGQALSFFGLCKPAIPAIPSYYATSRDGETVLNATLWMVWRKKIEEDIAGIGVRRVSETDAVTRIRCNS